MKYAEFAALCKREFQLDRGDVRALHLTGPSAAELAKDILTDPAVPIPSALRRAAAPIPGVAAAAVTSALNPVTSSKVTVTADAQTDTAAVAYGPLAELVRTVAAA